jgi:hypothetical protein
VNRQQQYQQEGAREQGCAIKRDLSDVDFQSHYSLDEGLYKYLEIHDPRHFCDFVPRHLLQDDDDYGIVTLKLLITRATIEV